VRRREKSRRGEGRLGVRVDALSSSIPAQVPRRSKGKERKKKKKVKLRRVPTKGRKAAWRGIVRAEILFKLAAKETKKERGIKYNYRKKKGERPSPVPFLYISRQPSTRTKGKEREKWETVGKGSGKGGRPYAEFVTFGSI